ncbi:MAG TPA: hypothetical protein VLD63_10885 [Anaerolineales bacterium]|nr:hypothetical protein [Anaerolineales bacterium]
MGWKPLVLVAAIVTYLYILTTEWIDLFPWNDLSRSTVEQKISGSLVNLVPFALVAAAFVLDINWLKVLSAALLVAWLAIHIAWWWVPYFSGASNTHLEQYSRLFARTYKFLPPRGTNPIPTAQYVVMQVLTLITLTTAIVSIIAGRSSGYT